ncbi:UvrD-helicase domain-containing protein [Candidatus Nitrosotenuis uzonensis]|uniref:DNA 3'-5' helicase n=1 Tax=Candidatus Nitrosotenuis uzonensis TaxID=1407055 RepID=A0A812EV76_9ARCH|nr:ATP-dependent DNA helicase [Candidatus Nitrosotenuis uzonensis]CAE6492555.1 putative ATP-dependent DNA helicase [Candidatus Nitrosotenuis uzonensis]
MSTSLQPSKEQAEILNSDRNTIVISNPGTGKTTTLSMKVMSLLESGVKPEEILCITFTEKAKKEMFDAIFKMAKGKLSDSDLMKLNIHTFHSFAYNYLVDAGLVTGDIVGNNVMRYSILGSFESNKAFNYSKDYIISDIVPKTENAIRYIKSFGITPDKIDVEKAQSLLDGLYDEEKTSYSIDEMKAFLKYFVDAYKNYEDSKQGAIDYSDMLLIFIEKFRGKKFQHVLVDEMQDMNELEAKIAQMVGENLFLVGDAKQAIFGFQGGSVKNFHMFMKMCEPKLLSLNRRSSQEILDYSKSYFLGKTKYKELFERELEFFKSQGNGQIPKVISTSAHLSKILDVIENNPEKTIGIISRTNRQIIEISQYLDTNNIKYSSTSSQATAEQAKGEILSFVKGLVSDRIEDKIAATFTIFSPYSLKEAFEFSSAFKKRENGKLDKVRSWGISMKREDLDGVFAKVVFPLCVSKGAEWFSTAIAVKQQIDQYLALGVPTMDGLFDFIAIGEESYVERSNESKITLTTVHKAKGRAFDVVVYIPSSAKRTSFIDIIVEAVLASNGIDIKEELEEESLRIDFVAFTRAKEKLVIIADDKNSKNYHIERLSEIEVDDRQDELVATRLNSRLSEAFSLFVAGRFQDSEKLLKGEDGWLEEFILNYFKNIDHFSYSSIKTDPYEFLIENIIKIPAYYIATDFGSAVHSALADISMGRAKLEDFDGDVRRAVENGLNAIEQLKKDYQGLKIVGVEKWRNLPLRSLVDYDDPTLMFTGFIDAVFQHDKGYLIVDYKTDKNSNRASDHKRQLSVYRKMHSILEGIPEDRISTCIVFVALRGGINTGKFDWSIETEKRNAFPTFLKHLQVVLEWKKDPKRFIQDLLEKPRDDPLYQAIKEKLQSGAQRSSL